MSATVRGHNVISVGVAVENGANSPPRPRLRDGATVVDLGHDAADFAQAFGQVCQFTPRNDARRVIGPLAVCTFANLPVSRVVFR